MTGESSSTEDASPTFDLLPLSDEVRSAVLELGWVTPTPVQLAAFGPASEGADVVVQARTGTGKTAAFGLPIIDKRVKPGAGTQVLILAPTRELALQSARELARIGQHKSVRTAAVYGGAPIERQIRELDAGVEIVSGTPGRVLDHLRRGSLVADGIRALVLDEADEMLSMGFAKELNAIVDELPKARQTMLFSATIDEAVERLAGKFLKDPVHLSLSSDQVGAQTIAHFVYLISGLGKSRDLIRILEAEDPESAIIFCNTKAATEQLTNDLQVAGLNADLLNGDLPQSEREKVLDATRKGTLRYLVATDVAARGIDISHLTHVINYDFPDALEQYVHRTGRTGRAGRTGTAISLIAPADLGQLYYLRLQYKIFPTERVLPSEGELRARSELDRIEMIRAAFASHRALKGDAGLRALARRLLAHEDAEAIVAGLVGSFLGAHGSSEEVEDQAAAARRARLARPADATGRGPADDARAAAGSSEGEDGSARRRRRRERPAPTPASASSEVAKPTDDDDDRDARDTTPLGPQRPSTRSTAEASAEEPATDTSAHADEARAAVQVGPSDPRAESSARAEEDEAFQNVFLNIGRRDGTRVGDILRLFDEQVGLGKDTLGRIRIRDRHTFVAVPREAIASAIEKLGAAHFGEKALVAEIARAERTEG